MSVARRKRKRTENSRNRTDGLTEPIIPGMHMDDDIAYHIPNTMLTSYLMLMK